MKKLKTHNLGEEKKWFRKTIMKTIVQLNDKIIRESNISLKKQWGKQYKKKK